MLSYDRDTCLVLVVLALVIYLISSRNKLILPPGPPSLPVLGNLLQVPRRFAIKRFVRWKDMYGPILHFRIFGRRFIMLSDLRVATDLLEKRSLIHSSRPVLQMARLIGRDKTALFLPTGRRCKETRKLMITFLSARSESFYIPVIEEETYRFIGRLNSEPDEFFGSINSLPAAVILKLVYGYQIDYKDDYFVELAERLGRLTTEATDPGRWLVDAFPIIRYLPSWLPGMGFKKWAMEARVKCESFTRAPHDFVKTSMATGQFLPSFTSSNLQKLSELGGEAEEIVLYTSASMYSGGTDTVVSVTKLFFLMMAVHPDIQKKAQKEVDMLIGDDRPPSISDQSSLPYISCIIKELLRFNPVVPIAVHSPVKDDIYNGFLIPKDAWIMANIWCMSHDPLVYPEPHAFKPERFDKSSGAEEIPPDPFQFVFGFGRRVCPGQYFAEKSLFMVIACVLWAFNITPEKDSLGRPLVPEVAFSSGHSVHPKPFRCTIEPRSSKPIVIVEELVNRMHIP